jgi:muconolactone D-isomerase
VLFAVRMEVHLPADMDPGARAQLLAKEKTYSQELQRAGKWPHIWRIAGQYANLSILDVSGNAELHDLLWNLPLFPHMTIDVTALAPHPSDIAGEDIPPRRA